MVFYLRYLLEVLCDVFDFPFFAHLIDSRFPASINLLHLVNSKPEYVDDILNVLDFIERKRPAFAGFEVFVEHLIATNMKRPHLRRNGGEILCLVDMQPLVLRVVSRFFNREITSGDIDCQSVGNSLEQVGLHEFTTKGR